MVTAAFTDHHFYLIAIDAAHLTDVAQRVCGGLGVCNAVGTLWMDALKWLAAVLVQKVSVYSVSCGETPCLHGIHIIEEHLHRQTLLSASNQ